MDERLQFVARRLAGEPMAELCREFAISRKTGYKILAFKGCRQEQAPLSLCSSTSFSGGKLYPECEARAHHLGSS